MRKNRKETIYETHQKYYRKTEQTKAYGCFIQKRKDYF